MALIKCMECKKKISDQAASCPGCGAPVIAPTPKPPAAPPTKTAKIITGALGLLLIFAMVKACSPVTPTTSQSSQGESTARTTMSDMEALTLCQMTIKQISKDPEKASVPYVKDNGSGSESYFAWGASTKMLRLRNGLGLEVAGTGSCIVNRDTGRITQLTVNGADII